MHRLTKRKVVLSLERICEKLRKCLSSKLFECNQYNFSPKQVTNQYSNQSQSSKNQLNFCEPIRTTKIQSINKLTKLTKLKERDKERHTMWLGSSPDCASSTRLSEYVSPQITKRVIWEFIDQKLDEQKVHSLQLKPIIL